MSVIGKTGKIVKYFILSILSLFFLLILTISILLVYNKEAFVQAIADIGLDWYGLTNKSFKITRITSSKLVLQDVSLGDPDSFNIKKIDINYTPKDLLSGKINEINIDSLNAHGEVLNKKNNKISFGNIDKIIQNILNTQQESPSGFKKIKYKIININNSNLFVREDNQKLTLPFSFLERSGFEFSDAEINIEKFDIPSVGQITLNSSFSGKIPYDIKNNNIIIKKGELFSLKDGIIKIIPYRKSKDEQTNFLYNLFSDFQYKNLHAKMTMDESQVIKFNFSFLGRNKNFYDGKAVKLNVNLSIEAKDLINYIKLMLDLSSDKNLKLKE